MGEQFETAAGILADYQRIENESTLEDRFPAKSIYGMLKITAEKHADRPASSFQLLSEPGSKAQTLSIDFFFAPGCGLHQGLGAQV